MSVDILGTSCDQCRSMVQYIFTSTETRRLVRTDDGHLDFHTAPELCGLGDIGVCFEPETLHYRDCQLAAGRNGVAARAGYNQTGKRNFRSVPCSDRL